MQLRLIFFGLLSVNFACIWSSAEENVHVESLHINSNIQSRFATTLVKSQLINPTDKAQEIFFNARLPDAAFISNFSMEIGGRIIVGNVKEKEQAKQDYDRAVSQGQSAGLVSQKARETNSFTISTNVGAQEKVAFTLTYQEVLQRVHGAYKHVINLQSDKLESTSDVRIDVTIVEQGLITKVSVPKFGPKMSEKTNSELLTAEQEPNAQQSTVTSGPISTSSVTYRPNMADIDSSNGTMAGQLVVLYDVERDYSGGQIQVVNGYFVHFFAPKGLSAASKHVVFVLDKSGSMNGRKFLQTQASMYRILDDLRPTDRFNIIMFESVVTKWQPESILANEDNINRAKEYVNASRSDGGTNVYDSLAEGLNTLTSSQSSNLVPMVIFMTDGEANEGNYTRTKDIVEKITEKNIPVKAIIHSIAFGDYANFELLQQLSTNNRGIARKVYEDSDADIQLTGFYAEISSPMLTDVKIDYLNETVEVDSLVQDHTYNYYDGGEMMVVGKLKDNTLQIATFDASINGKGRDGPVNFSAQSNIFLCPSIHGCCVYRSCPPVVIERALASPSTVGGFIERMWAYKTIKKMLKEAKFQATEEQNQTNAEALRLSLKYGFVTELTSMVVIQPDSENATALSQDSDRGHSSGEFASYRSMGVAGVSGLRLYSAPGHPVVDAQEDDMDVKVDPDQSMQQTTIAQTPSAQCTIHMLLVLTHSDDKSHQLNYVQECMDKLFVNKQPQVVVNVQVVYVDDNGYAAELHAQDNVQYSEEIRRALQARYVDHFAPQYHNISNVLRTNGQAKNGFIWVGPVQLPHALSTWYTVKHAYREFKNNDLPSSSEFCSRY